MSDVALYFPYVNLPGDAWVKAAALHWPQLGRIRPQDYADVRDSDTVRRLRDECGFVLDVRPGLRGGSWVGEEVLTRADPEEAGRAHRWLSTEEQVDALFYDFLDRHRQELIPRYGAGALGVASLRTWDIHDGPLPLDPRLQRVDPAKISAGLTRRLAEAGLLVSRSYQWRRASDGRVLYASDLAMHRSLARVYLAVLADVVARENGMTPVTDQALMCALPSGWTIDAMARVLLAEGPEGPADDGESGGSDGAEGGEGVAGGRPDHGQVFAVLALQTVLPRDLDLVPVERIVEARRRLLPELMAYREFLDSLTPDFVEISLVPDPEVRAARLRNRVEREIARPLETMERELGRLGLQPVRAVLSLQSLAPPAALGVLAGALHLPPVVTGAGVAAGCLVGAANGALDQRRQTLAGHPAGYLLHLRHELGPSDTVARIRSAMRRATHRRGPRR
ncbi:DUF6236 family protein [Streptomyces hoynatensis]|uniref:Uncharacterized protein n=1 Tax=Streptomyces hoynatensis TaxID=1141874 RepID=A0A3A9Z674_9ACTN|nr:DUF6236 family protein [Streptomyces hoynatensis]RKN43815.1 hypothetical protein D7294_08855 [Streptomyces hoynatensis]